MKFSFSNLIGLVLLILLGCSCGKAPQDKQDILPPSPESKIFSSQRVPANMVDYIFSQMSDSSPALKALLENDDLINRNWSDWETMLNDYNKYEDTYLKSAFELLQKHSFADTLLRDQIYLGLKRMEQRQKTRTEWIEAGNNAISELVRSKEDKLIVLKVLLTMPVLETYLTEHMPDSSMLIKLKNDVLKQHQTIESLMLLHNDRTEADTIKQ